MIGIIEIIVIILIGISIFKFGVLSQRKVREELFLEKMKNQYPKKKKIKLSKKPRQ